jgi:hypothetical protein
VLAALGRALFCFLSIEEAVTAIVYESGASTLPMMRAKVAGTKETALQDLADRYRAARSGVAVANSLDAAVIEFRAARQQIRNVLLHAHPFTAGSDSDGNYMPGLAYTARDGQSWRTVSQSPEDLLDLAEAIEGALDSLNAARELVQATPLSALLTAPADLAQMPDAGDLNE